MRLERRELFLQPAPAHLPCFHFREENQKKEIGKIHKKTSHQRDLQIANKRMKRFSISQVIRTIQIKTTTGYCFIPTRMVKIKETSVGEGVGKLEPPGGNIKWCNHW